MQNKQSTAGVRDGGSALAWPADQRAEPLNLPAIGMRQPRTLRNVATGAVYFFLHFLEMAIAMWIGMAVFGPVKLALVSQGYTALLDTSSIDYLVWMNLFMVVPMVVWMRARGCSWWDGAEMGGAMIGPMALVLVLCHFGVSDVLPWFTRSLSGIAMLLGMLAIMLYRREHFTSGYSFIRLRRGQSSPQLNSERWPYRSPSQPSSM